MNQFNKDKEEDEDDTEEEAASDSKPGKKRKLSKDNTMKGTAKVSNIVAKDFSKFQSRCIHILVFSEIFVHKLTLTLGKCSLGWKTILGEESNYMEEKIYDEPF